MHPFCPPTTTCTEWFLLSLAANQNGLRVAPGAFAIEGGFTGIIIVERFS